MIGTEDSGIESQINYKLLYINKNGNRKENYGSLPVVRRQRGENLQRLSL